MITGNAITGFPVDQSAHVHDAAEILPLLRLNDDPVPDHERELLRVREKGTPAALEFNFERFGHIENLTGHSAMNAIFRLRHAPVRLCATATCSASRGSCLRSAHFRHRLPQTPGNLVQRVQNQRKVNIFLSEINSTENRPRRAVDVHDPDAP
ncbi:MAG: hypothetical protein MZV64_02775 [Ignavibacteriales bacterium]|nr:hypothetical protein [Ignavibacteriales bacterium]